MTTKGAHAPSSASLSPLPQLVYSGLSAVATTAVLSLVCTAILFGYLTYHALASSRRLIHINQYVAMLINLLFADLLQAFGFTFSLRWLQLDGILAGTSACWAQGWLLNAGDVGSAAFTLAIAVHLFSDIVLDRRMGPLRFLSTVIFLWTFTIFCASIGVAMYPSDFYMRAGLWCWIPENHIQSRLWLHYIWLIITQFGVVIIYSLMFFFLRRRASRLRWTNEEGRLRYRAEAAARSVIAYPIVYVICTLPVTAARLTVMAGGKVGIPHLAAVGALIASNGWVDVITYSVTRYSLIFGTAIPNGEIRDFQTLDATSNCPPTTETKKEQPVASVTRMEMIYPGSIARSCATMSTDSLYHDALNSNKYNV